MLHAPPLVPSVSNKEAVAHIAPVPEIGETAGPAFTVSTAVVLQPAADVKVIFAVPADTPVTTPVPETTVAKEISVVLHVPEISSVTVAVPPTHTFKLPEIASGIGLTVTAKLPLTALGDAAPIGCTLVNV